MDFELKLMLKLTRRLPRVKGAGVLANALKRFYLRKSRESVDVDVLGFAMRLDPSECVDGGLLFYPHLYEHHEIAFLKKHLQKGDVFLDVGAHIGFYSLIASKAVGVEGRVLAIEADPYNYERLRLNLQLNNIRNVQALNIAVSDKRETLRLGTNRTGNRGGSSFLSTSPDGLDVECYPLSSVLKAHRIYEVRGAKFDIEGFEFRVLKQFFADVDQGLYPKFIIIEHHPEWVTKSGGDAIDLLISRGYHVHWAPRWWSVSSLNYILPLQ